MGNQMIDIDALVETVGALAPLPQSSAKLVRLLAQPGFDVGAVAEVIERDAALTAQILRTTNSALHAASMPITTVRKAVVRLGFGPVLFLAVSAAATRVLKRAVPEYDIREGEMWMHSVMCSLSAESLCRRVRGPLPPETATVALLHDIGKLILARFLSPAVVSVLHEATKDRQGGIDYQAEFDVLDLQHSDVGALVAQQWKLPETIVHGIRLHHDPSLAYDQAPENPQGIGARDFGRMCDVVHLSDCIVHRIDAATQVDPPDWNQMSIDHGLDPGSLERLEIDVAVLPEVAAEVLEGAANAA